MNEKIRVIRRLDDEAPEGAHRHVARPAEVDHRRRARVHADEVGVEAESADRVLEDVGMGIDHAGEHEPSVYVNDFACGVGPDIRFDCGDAPGLHRDIARAVHACGGVDDPPALQHQVVSGRHDAFPRYARSNRPLDATMELPAAHSTTSLLEERGAGGGAL